MQRDNRAGWLLRSRVPTFARAVWFAVFAAGLAAPAFAQDQVTEGMAIKRVEIQGLQTINEGFVRRLIKTREGQTFSRNQVQEDVRALLRSRKFLNVFAETRVEDGQAVVIFTVQEKPTIVTVEIEGNKKFTVEELFKELSFQAGSVLDRYEINRGRENILRKYKEAGYLYATVELDENSLKNENRVIYRITEGPRVKVRKIVFEGNRSFTPVRLQTKIGTKTYLWIFRTGAFDEEQADRDVIELQTFYRDEGFLDARVGYRQDFTDVARTNLTLTFVIEEGTRYQVQDVRIEGNTVFTEADLRSKMALKPGAYLRQEVLREDVKRIQDMYGEIGYVDARVETAYEFLDQPGVVTLRYIIVENKRSKFGRITIRGNEKTQDKVIRRELRFYPEEDYNTVKAKKAERRIMETSLFSRATITPLEDLEGYREALVEVEEGEQVDFLIGVGVSTDNGVIGSLTIGNRNFDLFDWPRTWGHFFRGQAFRGAGQRLKLQLEPGTEVSRFRIDFTEPYLFDMPVRLDTSVYLFERDRGPYTEGRLGFLLGLSRRFESGVLAGWAVEGAFRVEGVKISDVDPFASRQIRDQRGDHLLTGVKGTIVRDTTDSRVFPTEGYRLSFSWEQVGALGGDYDFGKPSVGFEWYKTLRTDVFDRKSVLGVRADMGYIVGDAPMFERFYAGGFGTLRGFDYRGISPRAGVFNNAVGGDFIFLTGAEYSIPLYSKTVRGVTFLDMGTVEENFEITSWRAAVGFGLRIQVDFFGPVPIVLDFGFPVAKDKYDETRVFTFSFGASFR